jgi:hypothetical protein
MARQPEAAVSARNAAHSCSRLPRILAPSAQTGGAPNAAEREHVGPCRALQYEFKDGRWRRSAPPCSSTDEVFTEPQRFRTLHDMGATRLGRDSRRRAPQRMEEMMPCVGAQCHHVNRVAGRQSARKSLPATRCGSGELVKVRFASARALPDVSQGPLADRVAR